MQKNRKVLAAAAGGGGAAQAKRDGDSGGSATPSPEKNELPVPVGKPKRVRPVSSTSSPATSIVVAGCSGPQAPNVLVIPAVPSLSSSFSRPRAKKLLQGSLCFAVCAFDTTVPVPLRSAVPDFDTLLVAIHNQVSAAAALLITHSSAFIHSSNNPTFNQTLFVSLSLLCFLKSSSNNFAQFFLGFSQPDHLQLTTLTLDGEVTYTRATFEASLARGSAACVILNASCSEVSDSLPIWSLESQCFFWVREYQGDRFVPVDVAFCCTLIRF